MRPAEGKSVAVTGTELHIFYEGLVEKKRTDRDKDWPFITSLGTDMLRSGDSRGWLHLFEPDAIFEMMKEVSPIPTELFSVRPALRLAASEDQRLRQALLAERHFWQELEPWRFHFTTRW